MRNIMWSLLPIISLILINLSPGSGGPPNNWPTALIHHPQAALDYFKKTNYKSGNTSNFLLDFHFQIFTRAYSPK